MKEKIQMIAVLSIISLGSGFWLSTLKNLTQEKIEMQFLLKGTLPAVVRLFSLEYADPEKKDVLLYEGKPIGDPITQRVKTEVMIKGKKTEITLIPLKKEGQLFAVAFETISAGGAGDVVILTAFSLDGTDKILGAEVSRQSETTGFGEEGTRAEFIKKFKGLPFDKCVLGDGIDAISGATISSGATCNAVNTAIRIWQEQKEAFLDLLNKSTGGQ